MPKVRKLFVSAVALFLVISTIGGMSTPVYAADPSIAQVNPYQAEIKKETPPDVNDTPDNRWSSHVFVRLKLEEVEDYKEIPLYLQTDYPELAYGDYGTVASHGCGLVSLWMVATYLNDKEYKIEELAEQFGDYNTSCGSLWILFKDSAEELGLDLIVSECPNGEWYSWDMIIEALENEQPVVLLMNEKSLFTSTGHFIVLSGLTDDGKIIVNDPNGKNYEKSWMVDGYENGFTVSQMKQGFVAAWIYEAKEARYVLNFDAMNQHSRFELMPDVSEFKLVS